MDDGLKLTKIRTLLRRRGIEVPYRTLYRYCVPDPRTAPVIARPSGGQLYGQQQIAVAGLERKSA